MRKRKNLVRLDAIDSPCINAKYTNPLFEPSISKLGSVVGMLMVSDPHGCVLSSQKMSHNLSDGIRRSVCA